MAISRGQDAGRYAGAPLPEGMDDLLRLVTDQTDGARASVRQDAAWRFLRDVVFHAQADDYRLLAANPGASPAELRRNRRMLLQWLHPDVSPTGGDVRLLQRMNEAWQRLERGEGRRTLPHAPGKRRRQGRPVPVMFRPGFGVGRQVVLITLGLAVVTLLTMSAFEWMNLRGRCPDLMAALPFCRFAAVSGASLQEGGVTSGLREISATTTDKAGSF